MATPDQTPRRQTPVPPPTSRGPLPGNDADHSMNDETPLGWDQAPTGEDPPSAHRHPRQDGKGGTPDTAERLDDAQDGK